RFLGSNACWSWLKGRQLALNCPNNLGCAARRRYGKVTSHYPQGYSQNVGITCENRGIAAGGGSSLCRLPRRDPRPVHCIRMMELLWTPEAVTDREAPLSWSFASTTWLCMTLWKRIYEY